MHPLQSSCLVNEQYYNPISLIKTALLKMAMEIFLPLLTQFNDWYMP